jgi:hypothetical protein
MLTLNAQVLEWIAMLLDAHLPKLLLNSELHPLVSELQANVMAEKRLCEKMLLLKGALGIFTSSKEEAKQVPAFNIPDYSIEIWHPFP